MAVLRGDSKVAGTVTFEQQAETSPTSVSWDIKGHDANAQRAFHVHQFGDNTNGCTSAGPHCNAPPFLFIIIPYINIYIYIQGKYADADDGKKTVNPHGKSHGSPDDSDRHVGDLGNFNTNTEGNAVGNKQDSFVKLFGAESVLGRTLVVHAGTDDMGKGGNEESKKTGNAGGRPACGVIGIAG